MPKPRFRVPQFIKFSVAPKKDANPKEILFWRKFMNGLSSATRNAVKKLDGVTEVDYKNAEDITNKYSAKAYSNGIVRGIGQCEEKTKRIPQRRQNSSRKKLGDLQLENLVAQNPEISLQIKKIREKANEMELKYSSRIYLKKK
ncbi:hypothetical protein [uncultured Draconibacterium sp.]|uniref:hypothetical protein n=1 Tax=uncultured Draconibacterium sp. TaxID=1573823 RepID=UPI003217EB6C